MKADAMETVLNYVSNPGVWIFWSIWLAWLVVFRRELRKRRVAALPNLLAYSIAAIWLAVYFFLLFDTDATVVKVRPPERAVGYLLFTSGMLAIGIWLHWRAVRRERQ
ncbi:MAG: hypothetical protein ACK47B_07455 [Armatimonadota bacterium]